MRKMKKIVALSLSVIMLAGTMAACTSGGTDGIKGTIGTTVAVEKREPSGLDLSICLASEPDTIDPALNKTTDGAMNLQLMFEGLMKWANSGDGTAELTNGQVASYEISDDGTVYTFKLRDDIKWSDGKEVTAEDFVYSWQRLVAPDTAADYNYMIDMVVNANEIMEAKAEPDTLGIKAIDSKTLEITLTYACPYFLEVCAFPATLPVRQDIIEAHGDQWTFEPKNYIGNGGYTLKEWVHNSYLMLEASPTYYDYKNLGPDTIKLALMDDDNAILASYNSGELQFIRHMPVDEIPALKDSGKLKIVDYIGTYYAVFNNEKPPFDDPRVREAFSLVIDRNYIVEKVTRTGEIPAAGFVPGGIYDAEGSGGEDFRTVGGEYYSTAKEAYEANCERARELLAEAGFPNGEGFPTVEYLYNTNDRHKVIAEALQNMWKTELGVSITINNQDWNVFLNSRNNGEYQVARNGWIADYNDPITFIDMMLTDGGNNDAQYSNPEFDKLVKEAKSTSDVKKRMELLHQAEDLLMKEDVFSAPIYFYSEKYMMNEELQGLYYTPLGYFFFDYITKK